MWWACYDIKMNTPTVTIGFTARERFNLAAKSLKAIYKHTHIPFNLIVVDCNIPTKYLKQMREVLKDKSNVKIIHTDNYLRGNQSKNLVLDNTTDDYVALIENDCFVSDGWLEKLMDACERTGSTVAIPLLLEDASWLNPNKVHHDTKLAEIKMHNIDGNTAYEFVENLSIMNRYKENEAHRVASMEMHVMLIKREVFSKIGKFDELVLADSTYAYVDLSLSLLSKSISIICEPNARVSFMNPPPVYKDELPFYNFIWNLNKVSPTREYLAKKWNILNIHDSLDFVSDQQYRTSYFRWILRKGPKKINLMFSKIF